MQTEAFSQNQFVSMNSDQARVLSRLSFLASEPFAVTAAFRIDHGRWIEWTFARDLLIEGLTEPSGIGDVRVRPDLADTDETLFIEIESPDGYALIEFDRVDVEAFIDASIQIVPIGSESEHFNVDMLIEEISNV